MRKLTGRDNEAGMAKKKKSNLKKELYTSEIRYRRLFESAKDGILILNAETGRIVDVNPFLIKLLGFSKLDFTENSIWEIGTFQDIYQNKEKFLELQHKKYIRYDDLPLLTSTGKIIHVEFVSNVYTEDQQEVIQCNIRDITEHKRTDKELIAAKVKAEENDRLKSAFLANMSHEIRTPMNGILGFADLLRSDDLSGEEQLKYIDIIEKSGIRLLNLINDIISISKIESNQIDVTFSEVNINLQFEDLLNFFSLEANNKKLNISFKNHLPVNEWIIKTDSNIVYAVLVNLVKNAIKFTQTGSIEFGCLKKDGFFEFYVKDSGSGIPEEKKNIIFERFRQGNDQLTRSYEGAGLGLSISKAYVEMLGGKIWVENNADKNGDSTGATFFFTIPALPVKETKHVVRNDNSENTTNYETGMLNILIVENDEISKILLTNMVKGFSRKMLTASSGVEAVELCRKNPDIDLVLMDINMPKMDGYEATRKIREFNTEVIIIAQTGYALVGDKEKALEAGCNNYISKPIDKVGLSIMINNYFLEFTNKN